MRADIHELKRMLSDVMEQSRKAEIAGYLPTPNVYTPTVAPQPPKDEPVDAESEDVTDGMQNGELTKEQVQREQIIRALRKHNGKRKDAARDLFISERTLYRKIKELGIDEY